MKLKRCTRCGQMIRNRKSETKKRLIKKLCQLMGWDHDFWGWKIQNTPLNYDMLDDIVNALQKEQE